jgi:hypothetical protein
MMRSIAVLCTFLLSSSASAQVRHAEELPLNELFAAAEKLALYSGEGTVWAGYSIHRQMYADSRFAWYGPAPDKPSLKELLSGAVTETADELRATARQALATMEGEQRLVSKEVAILFLFEKSSDRGQSSKVRLVTMDAPGRLDGAPILWLGSQSDAESLDFLEALLPQTADEIKDDVVTAIGAHDARTRVIRTLAGVARARGDQDEGETARHWLADHLSVTMGLRRDRRMGKTPDAEVRRAALYTLINVEEGQAADLLISLIRSSTDTEIRRLALIQLAHLDDRAGESALLGMAKRYLQTGG